MDLLDLQKYKRQNRFFRYLCVIIDCFTRFVWVRPLKNKRGRSIVQAISLLIMNETPKLLHCDSGTEFMNKDVKKMLEAFGPKIYASYSKHKASMAERVQRTLRNALAGIFEKNKNKNWISHIDSIVDSYNRTYHRSIKMRPIDVTWRDAARFRKRFEKIDAGKQSSKPRFKVGDNVRYVAPRKKFQKEMERGWHLDKYRIKAVVNSKPKTYVIENSQGVLPQKVYAQELQHVA